MAAVKMWIDKFNSVVTIQEDHYLAVAQRERDAAKGKGAANALAEGTPSPDPVAPAFRRLDGKPLEYGEDGLIQGEPLNLTDEQRATLPSLGDVSEGENVITKGVAPKKAPAKKSARRGKK